MASLLDPSLTIRLGRVTEHLSHETALSFEKHWTDDHGEQISLGTTFIIRLTSQRMACRTTEI